MPKAEEEVLSSLILGEKISAVTIDTSIFDALGRNFGNKFLVSLEQFNKIDVSVVFSTVVAQEVKSHIERDAIKTRAELLNSLNSYRTAWRLLESAEELGGAAKLTEDPSLLASSMWDEFTKKVDAKIIDVEEFDVLKDILNSYFTGKPPFSMEGKKKSEFPDAIILFSLERWARKKSSFVIAVSNDKDWINYADTSERIFCLPDMKLLFNYFNKNSQFLANKLFDKVYKSSPVAFFDRIKCDIEGEYEQKFVLVIFESDMYCDADFLHMSVLRCTPPEKILVISSKENEVTISVTIECVVDVSANFAWSVWDGIDKEYVSLSSDEFTIQRDYKFDLAITMIFDDEENVEIDNVEILQDNFEADFGYVTPKRLHE